MNPSTLSSLCEHLAREVADELRSGRSTQQRRPGDLRGADRAVDVDVPRAGGPPGNIARRLGLVESTLARRLRSEQRATAAGSG